MTDLGATAPHETSRWQMDDTCRVRGALRLSSCNRRVSPSFGQSVWARRSLWSIYLGWARRRAKT